MNIQERMDSINGVIKNIAEFIQTHEDIKSDFNEYLRTIGANTKTGVPLQTACFSYILERNLGEDLKSIPQLYLENTKGLDKDTKTVVEAIDGDRVTISDSHYGGGYFYVVEMNADSSDYATGRRFLGYIYIDEAL